MLNFQEIIDNKKIEVDELKSRQKIDGTTTVVRSVGQVRSFKNALTENVFTIIPELKKSDPWRGMFRENYDVAELTKGFHNAGARAIAVQVDSKYFMGDKEHLYMAAKNSNIPVLMRDFIIDEAQLTDAKSHGADAVILMPHLLSEKKIKSLINFSKYIMLEVIVEVNSLDELKTALNVGADVIGILNRDIKSQELRLRLGSELHDKIPDNVASYSVGGLKSADDLIHLIDAGFQGVLVGEKLMKAENPAEVFALLASSI
ncbi:MAG: indole-3-glycerol phosphate synthase TrpC [Planctomycetes bacterium]|nr:indole-3-glycerol phosphate synthase TrpC [Planctomycetota bacterium]